MTNEDAKQLFEKKTKGLTLIEAIQSGKPFKRIDETKWRESSYLCTLWPDDIVAIDWELKPEESEYFIRTIGQLQQQIPSIYNGIRLIDERLVNKLLTAVHDMRGHYTYKGMDFMYSHGLVGDLLKEYYKWVPSK
jgi:hypothetical protein